MAVARKRTLGYSPWAYPGLQPFEKLFSLTQNCSASGFKGIDCFLLSGGTDVHPGYYNENHHITSEASAEPSARDEFEWKAILYCKKNNIPIIGICRGAQLLCAAAGGTIIQDVDGHNTDHSIVTSDGEWFYSTSVHHQMMNPWKAPHELLAWAEKPRTKRYENGDGQNVREMMDNEEPEVVYFPELNGLAIQGHPEYAHASRQYVRYCVSLVEEKLLK